MNEIEQLKQRIVELEAQVELMSKITNCFHVDPDGDGVLMKDADGFIFRGILPLLDDASQCLAEIKAQAVEDALNTWRLCSDNNLRANLEFYANQLRQQAKP